MQIILHAWDRLAYILKCSNIPLIYSQRNNHTHNTDYCQLQEEYTLHNVASLHEEQIIIYFCVDFWRDFNLHTHHMGNNKRPTCAYWVENLRNINKKSRVVISGSANKKHWSVCSDPLANLGHRPTGQIVHSMIIPPHYRWTSWYFWQI